jgi:hypothetical protein
VAVECCTIVASQVTYRGTAIPSRHTRPLTACKEARVPSGCHVESRCHPERSRGTAIPARDRRPRLRCAKAARLRSGRHSTNRQVPKGEAELAPDARPAQCREPSGVATDAFSENHSRKKVVAQTAVVAASAQAALLESGVLIRTDTGPCVRASPAIPCRRERSAVRV